MRWPIYVQLCEALYALATEYDDADLEAFLSEANFRPSPLRTDGRRSLDAEEDEDALRIIERIEADWSPRVGAVLPEGMIERARNVAGWEREAAPSP